MTPARDIWAWLSARDRGQALALGAAVGLVAGMTQTWVQAPLVAALAALALAVAKLDARHFLIPDWLTLGVGLLGLADAALADQGVAGQGMADRALAMLALGAALWVLRAALSRWKGQTALGLGDVKFLVAACAWISPANLALYLFVSAISGLAQAALNRPRGGRIAFGAHLAPWLVAMVLARPWIG